MSTSLHRPGTVFVRKLRETKTGMCAGNCCPEYIDDEGTVELTHEVSAFLQTENPIWEGHRLHQMDFSFLVCSYCVPVSVDKGYDLSSRSGFGPDGSWKIDMNPEPEEPELSLAPSNLKPTK